MDVTNPGTVSVESETYGNPSPGAGTSLWRPLEEGLLVPAADESYPRPENDVGATTFPTPAEVTVGELPYLPPPSWYPQPRAAEVYVDEQVIGQGVWVYVDPLNPAMGKRFVTPADYTVVGPSESFQTNVASDDVVVVTVTAVLDADNLPNPPSGSTTRYYLVTAPPSLTSYPVSLLGRQVTFADDTLTAADQGASRSVQNYGGNFVVVGRDDPSDGNGGVPVLATPQVGDTFEVDVNRQGSEQVNTAGGSVDVFVSPSPEAFVPNPAQSQAVAGSPNVSTGPQPGHVIITGGVVVPTAVNVSVPDQAPPVGLGLPADVFV